MGNAMVQSSNPAGSSIPAPAPCAPSLLYRGEPAFLDLAGDSLFMDLNLDPILTSIAEGLEWADLPALFRQKPAKREDVEFRLGILKDLELPAVRAAFEGFAQSLRRARQHQESAEGTAPACVRQKWRLDACAVFCGAVEELLRRVGTPGAEASNEALNEAFNKASNESPDAPGTAPSRPPQSLGLRRFLAWLAEYAGSPFFRDLRAASAACERGLSAIRYQLAIDMPRNLVTLSPDASDADFCGELAALFPQFDLSPARQEIVAFSDIHLSALEARLLEILEKAHPEAFKALDAFCRAHAHPVPDPRLAEFQRELSFLLACLRFADGMRARGFEMSLPRLTEAREIHIEGGYDLSLALKSQAARGLRVVPNDFHAARRERCFVLTGPNQAGKTTFARALGQAVYFASLGLPVAAVRAEIGFFPGLFTHFAVEEDLRGDSGRLKEELTRLRPLLDAARDGFVILNELFASTTTLDARQMARHTLQTLIDKGCTCLYVTHLYELAAEDIGGAAPVSLVAAAGDSDSADGADPPAYTVARRGAQGLGLSHRLLQKHRLDSARIKERFYAAFPASS